MTTFVPDSGSTVLVSTPIVGSAEEAAAYARFAQLVADDVAQCALGIEQAEVTLRSAQSSAVSAVRQKLSGRLTLGARATAESASAAGSAFSRFAAEIDRIHVEALRQLQRADDALGAIRTCDAEIASIASAIRVSTEFRWDQGPPGAMPDPRLGESARGLGDGQREAVIQSLRAMYQQQWLHAAARWHDAITEVFDARRRWTALIDERRVAEQGLVAALGSTSVGQLISVGGSSVSAQRFAIATGLTGELRGVIVETPRMAQSHPLLASLLGTADGSRVWDAPPAPDQVAARWAQLSDADRQRLIAEVPWVIGNLPGLPYAVRDEANRVMVEFARDHPSSLSAEQLRLMADVSRILDQEARQAELRGEARPPIQVVALDLTGSVPRAAMGYGVLDTATSITWEVPGMASDAHLALESWDQASRNLFKVQEAFPGAHAVVAWLGYDTPDGPDALDFGVLSSAAASDGAYRLAAELDGTRGVLGPVHDGGPRVNVLAHSYGTTLASIALTRVRHPVQTFTMLGSAGLDTRIVPAIEALRVDEVEPGQLAVYSTHATADQLAPLGAALSDRGLPNPDARAPLGLQETSSVYGGVLGFSSEGDPQRGLLRTDGHSTIGAGNHAGVIGISASEGHGYMDPQTESLAHVAQITTDSIDDRALQSFTRSIAVCPELVDAGDGVIWARRRACEGAR